MTKPTVDASVPASMGSGTAARKPQCHTREDSAIAVTCYKTVSLDEDHERQAVEALTLLLAAWLKKRRISPLPPSG